MSRHGHVIPNENGSLAMCGGPVLCGECAAELASLTLDRFRKDPEDLKLIALKSRHPLAQRLAVILLGVLREEKES